MCYGLSKELVRLGHKVDVITMGFKGLKKYEIIDGINVYRVSCLRRKKEICYTQEMLTYVISAIPKVLQLTKWKKYDINHTHFIIPTGAVSYIIKKLTGLAYLITSHGSDVPGHNPNRFVMLHKLLMPIWKSIEKNADKVVTPSNYLQNLVRNYINMDNTMVIPNGFDTNKFRSQNKEKKILLVGRLLEFKGFQYFFEAIEGLDLDYKINILGDGPYKEVLMQKARKLNARVNFRGWLDKDSSEFKALYETSSVFIMPSEKESFGGVLLEAMSAEMAIITTNISGCPEVVGDSGLFVRPRNPQDIRNALLKLIENDDLRRSLGEKAVKRVKKEFSWTKIAGQYIDLYRTVVHNNQKKYSNHRRKNSDFNDRL